MKIGTMSVLFGAHCAILHPWFLALAWWRLWRWRAVEDPYLGAVSLRDWRLWVAFALHDLGYWGRPDMDGPEGEEHPWWAAVILGRWFGPGWLHFSAYHSRFLARRDGRPYSMLCVADKLAIAADPWWLYLPRVMASGEIHEYMRLARDTSAKYGSKQHNSRDYASRRDWHRRMTSYCRDWALTHADGRQDTWTPPAASGPRSTTPEKRWRERPMNDCQLCQNWAGDIGHMMLTGHNENCPHGPTREDALLQLVRDLAAGMEAWAADEDGIHHAAWDAYRRAKALSGVWLDDSQEPDHG